MLWGERVEDVGGGEGGGGEGGEAVRGGIGGADLGVVSPCDVEEGAAAGEEEPSVDVDRCKCGFSVEG